MKKINIVLGILTILLITSVCFGQVRNTTDRLSSSTLVCTSPPSPGTPNQCVLYGLLVETNGTNNVTVTIYDNTTNSGKILRKIIVPGANYYGGFEYPAGLRATVGIYVAISGTGGAFELTFGGGE